MANYIFDAISLKALLDSNKAIISFESEADFVAFIDEVDSLGYEWMYFYGDRRLAKFKENTDVSVGLYAENRLWFWFVEMHHDKYFYKSSKSIKYRIRIPDYITA